MRQPSWTIPLLLLGLLILGSVASLGVGSEHLTWSALMDSSWWSNEAQRFILFKFRIPRILAALIAGIALGTSGSIVQSVVKNPLASPDMLGITGGASVAWLTLLLIYPEAPQWAMPWTAFLGGVVAYGSVFALTYLIRGSMMQLTLIGIAVSVFSGSVLRILMVKFPMKINAGLAWLNGSLWGTNWDTLDIIWLPTFALTIFAMSLSRSLDVLALGEDPARQLGLNIRRTRSLALLTAVALGSLAVTLSGTIGFVGLVAPHVARRVVGHRHILVLPTAGLMGASLILLADMIARGLWQPIELPTGLFTAIIGAPYLLYLLSRKGGSHI